MNNSEPVPRHLTFPNLMAEEDAQLNHARGETQAPKFDPVIATAGAADEPWVAFTDRNRVGLALSGGGIRSAIFNLGLLQALQHKGVLEHVDYLATVSGGGYIGGFWTAWKLRATETEAGSSNPLGFPKQTDNETVDERHEPGKASLRDIRERKEFRHLREFSRFLMPRLSLLSVDLWNGLVAVLGGMVPSLLLTTVMLVGAWGLWLVLALMLSGQVHHVIPLVSKSFAIPLAAGALLATGLGIQGGLELLWRRQRAAEAAELKLTDSFWFGLFFALIAAGFLFVTLQADLLRNAEGAKPVAVKTTVASATSSLPELNLVVGVSVLVNPGATNSTAIARLPEPSHHRPLHVHRNWFAAALALTGAGFLALISRLIFARFLDPTRPDDIYRARALDRAIARCFVPAALWSGLIVVWWMATDGLDMLSGNQSLAATGGVAVAGGGSAAVFTVLRNWLGNATKSAAGAGIFERLKPLLPKLAANVAVVAAVVLVARLASQLLSGRPGWWLLGLPCSGLVVTGLAMWLLTPARIGLHEFYRSRIARCFLGAANGDSLTAGNTGAGRRHDNFNRQTHERAKDDFTLGELHQAITDRMKVKDGAKPNLAPIHLVCCAANNLAGDHLGTLYRGARSGVVSARGVSLGGDTRAQPDLAFSAALTASAAAFNSNMGFISMQFGPAVAFLTCALNLRLGLWVPHPLVERPFLRHFPGALFLAEMFGQTLADNSAIVDERQTSRSYGYSGWLHLSDGAHFENFGLYELVRRHCRYIVLTDCGADPDYSFHDFAHALRRIREDFGVEIEIDLDVLKPGADGLARQHVAVGTIHYDGLTGADKGTLVFFKPVLTGDEPSDVQQYKLGNGDFPQQTTADQFFDEPQWESYRRLGEHAGHSAFRFLDVHPRTTNSAAVDSIFHKAAQQWQAGWREMSEDLRALAEHTTRFETDIRREAPAWLRAEFFPESGASADSSKATADEQTTALFHLLALVQVMEDVWRLAELDSEWAHPLNQGWVAWLNRWAATPSFRRWWPVLKATCNDRFGKFVQLRLGVTFNEANDLPQRDQSAPSTPNRAGFRFREFDPVKDADNLIVRRWWLQYGSAPDIGAERLAYLYELLPSVAPHQSAAAPISLGLVLVAPEQEDGKRIFRWGAPELFVPPALEGSGFNGRFLEALIAELKRRDLRAELRVRLTDVPGGKTASMLTDIASRARRVHLVGFYKSRGFVLPRANGEAEADELVLPAKT